MNRIKRTLMGCAMLIAGLVQAEFSCSVLVGKVESAGSFRDGTIIWKNTGSAAIAAPYVRLDAGEGVLVRFTESEPWTKSLEFLATSPGAQASSLKGFEKGELKFLCQSPSDDGKLELSYTLASTEAFPWSDIGGALKPSFVSDAAWGFALKTLKARLGTTWNSYLGRFRADVDYLASVGRPVNRMDRLWQFEINRVLGIDPAVSTLARVTDAARSARGLGLSLSRSYPSAMYARFNKGMFGYGWADNLSVFAELTDATTLTFHMSGGGSYSFAKAGGVWEPEDLRDKTTLTENASSYVLSYQNGTKQTFAKSNMRTSSITDSSGNTLTFTWNGTQLTKITHTDGQSLTFAYSGGLIVSATDDCGRRTAYVYSGELLTSVTSAEGLVTRYEYRAADGTAAARALSRITYPDGTTKDFEYDTDGLVAAVSINGGQEKTLIQRADGVVTLIQPDGGKTIVKTGVSGEPLEMKDALGGTSVNGYTEDGLLKSMTAPSGLSGSVSHDALGRVAKSVSAGGNATAFAYEETFGNLKTVTDAKSHAVTYGYDAKGRGTSVSFPDGSMSKVEYNDRGDVVKSYNRRGESISYAYDAKGRVTQKTWSTGRTFSYSYDTHDNVTTATDSETGTVTMEYDRAERMTKIVYPGGRGFTFAYDACGRLSRRASLDGVAERFQYDQQGRLVLVTDDNGNTYLRNAYEESTGRLIRQENGNGTSTAYLYDKLGRVTSIEHCNAEGRIVEALQYCYDVDGRCIRASSLLGEECYGYDADGQLTGVNYPNNTYQSFAYDAVGNMVSNNVAKFTVNAMNQYTKIDTGADAMSLTYDTDGNLTSTTDSHGTTTYTYDTLNRLTAVKNTSAGIDWSCKYDVFGNRVSVTDKGVTTERVYLQGSLPSVAAEYVNGQLKERHLMVGAVRLADVDAEGKASYLHADLIGSNRLVTDDTGYVKSRASYLAFGGLRTATGSVESSAGYVGTLGVETDSTGLLFMRNRYYSPALGRFIQMDPIGHNGGDENLYRYCGNYVQNVDPLGLYTLTNFVEDAVPLSIALASLIPTQKPLVEGLKMTYGATSSVIDQMNGDSLNANVGLLGTLGAGAAFLGSGVIATVGSLAAATAGAYNLGGTIAGIVFQAQQRAAKQDPPFINTDLIRDFNEHIAKEIHSEYDNIISILDAIGDDDPSSGGGGTGSGQINNQSDWAKLASASNGERADYSLGADITIDFDVDSSATVVNVDGSRAWIGLCYLSEFSGRLNGNGHKITVTGTHITVDGNTGKSFLFLGANGAVFENVTFVGCGILKAKNCTFKNCRFTDYSLVDNATSCVFESCSGTANMAWASHIFQFGALVRLAKDSTFTNCRVEGVVDGADCTGGLVGDAEGCSFIGCSVNAMVSGVDNVGSLVGWAEGCKFENVTARGSVTGKGQVGGLVGYSELCDYSNCRADCTVTGGESVGGFVGDLRGGNTLKCSAFGNVVCNAGLDGSPDGFGGFAGQIIENAKVEDCLAASGISAADAHTAGGFAGDIHDAFIQRCLASGSTVGGGVVGGFVGMLMQAKTYSCCATGTVTAKGESSVANAGGFAGMASSSSGADCRYCYASGKTTASGGNSMTTVAGGFTPLGVSDSVAASMGSYLSMLMSESVACYWNATSTGCKYSGMGTSLTSTNAKNQSSYSGWDFGGVWKMGSSGPELLNVGATVSDDPSSGGDEDDPSDPAASDPAAAVDVIHGDANGSVKGTGVYKKGETVTLTATPGADSLFDGWYADAACSMRLSINTAYSFVVEDPEQRLYAKFSTKESKLDATRLYCYDKIVAQRGLWNMFQVDGTAPIGTTLTVSGLPEGFDFYGDYLMIAGTPTRTMSTTITVTLSNAAGTKTKKIPFVVVAPEGEEEDAQCVGFSESAISAAEGGVARVTVWGGSVDGPCDVKLYLAPASADAKDLDLTKLTVDGVVIKNAKFPLTLSWAAGDFSEKVVEIPIKTDTAIEGYEQFDLQLADANGIALGDVLLCSVSVKDETVGATLVQAVNNPSLKVKTSGDGKWIAANGNENLLAGDRGMYHLQSPALAPGKASTLELSGIKGSGKFIVAYRFVGDCTGETSASLRLLADKKPLANDTVLTHSASGSEWKTFTITDGNTGSHTYSYVFTQGSNPDVHVEISLARWLPDEGTAPVMVYVSSNGSGFGTVSGMGFYAIGSTAKIVAKPAPGRRFAGWYRYSTAAGRYELYDADHSSLSIKVTEQFDLYAIFQNEPFVRGIAIPADGGKVSGIGYMAAGKKVTLKATANKGYVFNGWYLWREGAPQMDEEPVTQAASYAFTMPSNDLFYVAKFVTAAEDKASIRAEVNGMAFSSDGEGAVVTQATNVMTGVYLEWPVAASALSVPTVKVAGLPSGLKFTAKPITTKVTRGTGAAKVTTVVTNVPANTIYGTPTKASTVDKYGEVKPSSVKISVTTAGKSKADYVISLTVDPIPAFVVGTFDGWYGDGADVAGSATLTVAANGKVSGKVLKPADGKGKTYAFSATSLSGFSLADDGSVTNVTIAATLTGENKAAVPLALTFAPDEIGIGCVEGVFESPWSGGLWLVQNGWKRGGYVFPYIPKDIVKTLDDGLTLTFKKNGVVSIGGKIAGDDGATLVSVKGSAQVVSNPESADGFHLLVYAPPAKNLAAGLCRLYDVELIDAAGDNVVTDVNLTELK